jgi:hypothetical protein
LAAAGNTYAVVRFWQAGGAMNPVPPQKITFRVVRYLPLTSRA